MKHPRAFEQIFQHVTALTWVSMFLGFAVTGWIVWLSLISWSVVEAYHLSKIIHASGTTSESETLLRRGIKLTLAISFIFTYGLFWWNDRGSEERGSHPRIIMRTLPVWKKLQQYFPINLVLCEDIMDVNPSVKSARSAQAGEHQTVVASNPSLFPTNRNYLVGYHPHGIFGVGAFVNFATEANQFSTLFPGLKPWITTLPINFKAPFHRDFLMSFNVISATYKGISYLLDPGKCGSTGNFVVIVMGGAPEALDSRPGKYIFHTNKRYGFFKLALMTGTPLVPCVSFGEPNMYHQVRNPPGCRLRTWQDKFTEFATFSTPLFYARALLPYRTPINTVVGAPIPVPKVPIPTREQISSLKELYLNQLNQLFKRYKPIYDPNACDLEFF
ncbi:diacylglycerol acyltransferase [Opisthorchis viverrini]|uniref:Acyltransferase n=1 Tax=Opisthorchis viverrini TaxID=6198 RepID=A0A1S8WWB5_OPIVI|nr:diacylglycerol acyltransferase [Opisthorchis viverrini]